MADVSTINSNDTSVSYFSWGNGVVAAMFDGPVNTTDANTGVPTIASDTPSSTVLVSGMLALACQKRPDATTNQTLQSLVYSGSNPNYDWNERTGYGVTTLGSLVNDDPSQYPDENPVTQKPGDSKLTVDKVINYTGGLVNPIETTLLPDPYVYHGADDQIAIYQMDLKTPLHPGASPHYHRRWPQQLDITKRSCHPP